MVREKKASGREVGKGPFIAGEGRGLVPSSKMGVTRAILNTD